MCIVAGRVDGSVVLPGHVPPIARLSARKQKRSKSHGPESDAGVTWKNRNVQQLQSSAE